MERWKKRGKLHKQLKSSLSTLSGPNGSVDCLPPLILLCANFLLGAIVNLDNAGFLSHESKRLASQSSSWLWPFMPLFQKRLCWEISALTRLSGRQAISTKQATHYFSAILHTETFPCTLDVPFGISNQSINQTSIAPISPAKPGSVARQPNQCSTAKSRKQFRNVNKPWRVMVSMGERPNQRDVSSDISWR